MKGRHNIELILFPRFIEYLMYLIYNIIQIHKNISMNLKKQIFSYNKDRM
jgi:hypothetical protein